MEAPPKKWVAYIRESSEEQGKGFNPEVQVDYCQAVIERSGGGFGDTGRVYGNLSFVPPPWVYGDIGGKGWVINRPGLMKLIEDGRDQKFDAVVVWRQDRLARTGDVLRIIEAMVSFGVTVYLEGTLYNPREKLVVQVRAMVSEEELDKMSKAISGGLQKAKASGRHLGRPPTGLEKTEDHTAFRISDLGERVFGALTSGQSETDVARALGITKWKVQRIMRNVRAFNEGRIDKMLEKQRMAMRRRKETFEEREREERQKFREWLLRVAPGKWD